MRDVKAKPCKIGTQPWTVYVDGRCRIEVGKIIRVRTAESGSKWLRVRVTKIHDFDGYFFADKI